MGSSFSMAIKQYTGKMKKKQTNKLNRTRKILLWLLAWFFPSHPSIDYKDIANRFYDIFEAKARGQGLEAAVDMVKSERRNLIQILASGDLSDVDLERVIHGSFELIPERIINLSVKERGIVIRFVLTLYGVSRIFRKSGVPAMDSITKPSKVNKVLLQQFSE